MKKGKPFGAAAASIGSVILLLFSLETSSYLSSALFCAAAFCVIPVPSIKELRDRLLPVAGVYPVLCGILLFVSLVLPSPEGADFTPWPVTLVFILWLLSHHAKYRQQDTNVRMDGQSPERGVTAYVEKQNILPYDPMPDNGAERPKEYVVIDFETTGLSCMTDRVIEAAAILYVDDKEVRKYSTLVDPERAISSKISDITGIHQKDLVGQPTMEQVLPMLLDIIGDRPIVAHNAPFDVGFLLAACSRVGLSPRFSVIDTLTLSRRVFPELRSHKLEELQRLVGVDGPQAHRALDDVRTCAAVYKHCTDTLKARDDGQIAYMAARSPKWQNAKAEPWPEEWDGEALAYHYDDVKLFLPEQYRKKKPRPLPGAELKAVKEPSNIYDPFAVKFTYKGKTVGYAYRGTLQDMLNDWLNYDHPVKAKFLEYPTAETAMIRLAFYRNKKSPRPGPKP